MDGECLTNTIGSCVTLVPITELKRLPQNSGIYMVLDSTMTVIYVGQAIDIHERWNKGHHKLGDIIAECGIDAYINWIELPEWLLNRAENAAYWFYQPKFNVKSPSIV